MINDTYISLRAVNACFNSVLFRNATAKMAAPSNSEQAFIILGCGYFITVIMFFLFEFWQRLGFTQPRSTHLPPVEALSGHATPPPPYQTSDGSQDAAQAGFISPTGLSIQEIRWDKIFSILKSLDHSYKSCLILYKHRSAFGPRCGGSPSWQPH